MNLTKYRLGDIATVNISGVDKKSKPGEIPVHLCNFVDVYYNWAVTKDIYDSLMVATCRQEEIDAFTLHKGYVAITKDSETRDDIGVACYIADDFDKTVVLGYHTALIIPDQEKLDAKYLNALLHTAYFQKYWFNNASGSGQRYTLSETAINDAPVYLPGINEQRKIGEFFSDLDRKIALNRKENATLEAMAKQLYDYWFVQFDFPDANGRPYKSSGGKMVWNETLKREIPEGWEVKTLKDITKGEMESIIPVDTPNSTYKHYSIPAFDSCCSYEEELGSSILSNKNRVTSKDVLVSKLNPWTSRVIWGTDGENIICSTEFVSLAPINIKEKGFIYSLAKTDPFIAYCTKASTGTSHSHRRVNPEIMVLYPFPYCAKVCQDFSSVSSEYAEKMMKNLDEIKRLENIRCFLLPLMMSGQIKID